MTTLEDEARRLTEEVTYGHGAVEQVPGIVRRFGARRVLLVCGRRSFESSGASRMLPALDEDHDLVRWSDFSPNTDADDLGRGLEILRSHAPDLVLAVGGGSAMDLAKLLCAFGTLGAGADLVEAIERGPRIDSRGPALVLVPTTSGSGSEATHFAVVYVGQDKHSIAGPGMLPDHVVLDPDLSTSGSPYQRASSGIDAVCQAIESLWATGATDESRDLARRALSLLLDHIEGFVAEPSVSSTEGMCLGSHLAGRAINISKTTAAHALSYGITMRHGISHGHAVALTLGLFIEAHADAGPDSLQPGVDPDGHHHVMQQVLDLLGGTDPAAARARFTHLLERIGLEPRLTAAGVTDAAERDALVAGVNLERLGNNPVQFGQDDLRSLLARAA